jgi:type IV secretion system protein VirB10
MKSKFVKKPEPDNEEEDADVESGGPSIASAKKSKFAIIAASSILITVVLYFLFFKGDSKEEKLVEVEAPKPASIAQSDDGKSPFALEEVKEKKEEVEILEKPSIPETPSLPDLPLDSIPKDLIPEPQEPIAPVVVAPVVAPVINQKPAEPIPAQNQAPATEKPKEINPRYAPIIVFGGTAQGTPARGVGYDNNIVNLNEDPIGKLQETRSGVVATYIKDRVHTIAQGKLLTAVLETAINTEIPGSVRAVVSRDVYGEAGNDVLIPRGSRLFGSYSSRINQGQGRVEISWQRLIRPDGVDLAIAFNASDQFGRSGIPGDVDSKYGSIIASSLLTSILAVGGVAAAQSLLTNDTQATTTVNPTQGTTTTTGSATNQAIFDVSRTIVNTVGQLIGNSMNVVPVIRVPQGTRITVIVNSDIVIPSQKNR